MKTLIKALFLLILLFSNALARDYIIVQSTTSTANTGLLDVLSKNFLEETGIEVRAVAVGTGTAIANAKKGDGDVLMVHAKADEIKFVEEGYGVERFDLMYNDFVIVGPQDDPAGISKLNKIEDVMTVLSSDEYKFISRDDNSGTHKKELSLWKLANLSPEDNASYIKTGSGMANTINVASEMNAYVLTDRGTWISFANKKDLQILYEGDKALFNPYGLIAVNPKMFPHVEFEKANQFIQWLINGNGNRIIQDFKIDGQQLFFTYK